MKKEKLKELKKISNNLKAEFNLGKNGITTNFIDTLNKYLDAHTIVKIKVSIAEDKNALEYFSNEIAKETNSEIIEKKGYTFTIYRD